MVISNKACIFFWVRQEKGEVDIQKTLYQLNYCAPILLSPKNKQTTTKKKNTDKNHHSQNVLKYDLK